MKITDIFEVNNVRLMPGIDVADNTIKPNDPTFQYEKKYGQAKDLGSDVLRKTNLKKISDILEPILPEHTGQYHRPTEYRGIVEYNFKDTDSKENIINKTRFALRRISQTVPGIISFDVVPLPTAWGNSWTLQLKVNPYQFGALTQSGFATAIKATRDSK